MPTSETAVAIASTPTNVSTETAIKVSDVVNYATGEGLRVRGVLNITPGTSTTAVVIKCHQGNGLAGTIIGPAAGVSHTLAAGASANVPFDFLDPAPVVTPQITASGAQPPPGSQYTVSVTQTAGTVAGNVNYGTLGVAPATTGW